jgi:hypothetical protein
LLVASPLLLWLPSPSPPPPTTVPARRRSVWLAVEPRWSVPTPKLEQPARSSAPSGKEEAQEFNLDANGGEA